MLAFGIRGASKAFACYEIRPLRSRPKTQIGLPSIADLTELEEGGSHDGSAPQ